MFSMIIFHIYVEAKKTDEGKLVKEFLILRVGVLKDLSGTFETAHKILFQVTDLWLLHTENLPVDVSHVLFCNGLEVFLGDRSQKGLDITDGEDILNSR